MRLQHNNQTGYSDSEEKLIGNRVGFIERNASNGEQSVAEPGVH